MSLDISKYIPFIKNPKIGVNYDPSLLHQAITYNEAQLLTKEIIKDAPNQVKYIIQISPNLGTIILALMKSERFDGLYTFVKGKEAQYLENNIEAWGLEDVVDINSKIDYTALSVILPESIVVINAMDPFINEGLGFMIPKFKKSPMIFIRSLEEIEAKLMVDFTVTKRKEPNSNILIYKLIPFTWDEKSRKKWLLSLKSFLKGFLSNFISPPSKVDEFFTDKYMIIWGQAFTTETIDPSSNYEFLETVGDRTLENCITRYIFTRYPTILKSQLNQFKSMLVSKKPLGKIATKFHLVDYVQTIRITKHVREDVFESFLGALALISDDIELFSSFRNCYKCVEFIFKNDERFTKDINDIPLVPGITSVRQFFLRLGFGTTKDSVVVSTQQPDPKNPMLTVTTISIPNEVIRGIANLGIKIPKNILGQYSDIDKTESEQEAFEIAYKYLASLGMTNDWVEKTAQHLVFQREKIKPYYLPALERAKEDGFVDILLKTSNAQTTHQGQISTLIGVLPDGSQEALSVGQGPNRNDSMENAIKNYVESD